MESFGGCGIGDQLNCGDVRVLRGVTDLLWMLEAEEGFIVRMLGTARGMKKGVQAACRMAAGWLTGVVQGHWAAPHSWRFQAPLHALLLRLASQCPTESCF